MKGGRSGLNSYFSFGSILFYVYVCDADSFLTNKYYQIVLICHIYVLIILIIFLCYE